MTADLYNDDAYAGRAAAWHQAGKVVNLPAPEAQAALGVASEEPLQLMTAEGQEVDWHVIVRRKPDGKIEHVSDPVRGRWTWLPHAKMAEIVNDCVAGRDVETIGILGRDRGDLMFLTYPLREFDLVGPGDQHAQFLFVINSLRAGYATRMGLTTVRMVCKNTVDAGLAEATVLFKAAHHASVESDTVAWFNAVLATTASTALLAEDALRALAGESMSAGAFAQALPLILPFRQEPKPTGIPAKDDLALHNLELHNARILTAHQHMVRLFDGEGTGMDQPGYAGTRLGAFNAVVEWADHSSPARDSLSRAEAVIAGNLPRLKARAYEVIWKWS